MYKWPTWFLKFQAARTCGSWCFLTSHKETGGSHHRTPPQNIISSQEHNTRQNIQPHTFTPILRRTRSNQSRSDCLSFNFSSSILVGSWLFCCCISHQNGRDVDLRGELERRARVFLPWELGEFDHRRGPPRSDGKNRGESEGSE